VLGSNPFIGYQLGSELYQYFRSVVLGV